MQVLRIPFDKIEEMQHLVLVMSMLSLKRKVPSVERLLLGPQKDCSRCLTVLMNLSKFMMCHYASVSLYFAYHKDMLDNALYQR